MSDRPKLEPLVLPPEAEARPPAEGAPILLAQPTVFPPVEPSRSRRSSGGSRSGGHRSSSARREKKRRARRLRIAAIVVLFATLYVLALLQASAIVAKEAAAAKSALLSAETQAKLGHLEIARTDLDAAARDVALTRSWPI